MLRVIKMCSKTSATYVFYAVRLTPTRPSPKRFALFVYKGIVRLLGYIQTGRANVKLTASLLYKIRLEPDVLHSREAGYVYIFMCVCIHTHTINVLSVASGAHVNMGISV